jgi:hypothetical protein
MSNPEFDPDERFSLPEDTDPEDVFRKLLETEGSDESEGVSEPEDEAER